VSSELPCPEQLNTLSVRFLEEKVQIKLCVSSLEIRIGCISKQAVSFQPSIKLATETTGENPVVWYACQTETHQSTVL